MLNLFDSFFYFTFFNAFDPFFKTSYIFAGKYEVQNEYAIVFIKNSFKIPARQEDLM